MSRDANWHPPILAGIAAAYPRCIYLEIGVAEGGCIRAVAPHAVRWIGVDVRDVADAMPEGTEFCHGSSDYFFERCRWALADLIFIDGDHDYDQAAHDFEQATLVLATGGTIALHDTWPETLRDTGSDVNGTVYRLREELERDLRFETFTFPRWPGLTLVREAG